MEVCSLAEFPDLELLGGCLKTPFEEPTFQENRFGVPDSWRRLMGLGFG